MPDIRSCHLPEWGVVFVCLGDNAVVCVQLQDVNEAEFRDSFRPPGARGEGDGEGGISLGLSGGHGHGKGGKGEFVVKGGPWEQAAPDTASAVEFPSFGGPKGGGDAPASRVQPVGPWGPRR